MIWPSRSSTTVALASAMTSAVLTMSLAPATKAATQSSACSRATPPTATAMTRNRAAISWMYHAYLTTPTIIPASVAANRPSTHLCVAVMPAKRSKALRSSALRLASSISKV
jgi:hypothetical protein